MFRTLVNNGLLNTPWDNLTFKNSEYLLNTFGVNQHLYFHDGCVNTISWDESGEYILSGSDDRKIAIIQVFDSLGHVPGEVLFSRKLSAQSNIFVARFLQNTNNQQVFVLIFVYLGQIIVGFKCGCVLHINTNDTSKNESIVCCHDCAVYDILTPPELPQCFATISHDRTVRIFDTRDCNTSPISSREHCSHQCSHVDQACQMGRKTLAACIDRMTFKFPVTAGDVHPLDGCRSMAFGFADGFVRLFDIRHLTTSGASSPTGDTASPLAYRIARPVDMPARVDDNQHTRCDYGPAYITSVKFEPVHRQVDRRWSRMRFPPPQLGGTSTRGVVSGGARCLLVSHMYAPVYLFDASADEVVKCTDVPPPDWLPPTPSGTAESSNGTVSNHSARRQQGNLIVRDFQRTNLDYRRALALIYWFGSRLSRRSRIEEAFSSSPSSSDRPTSSIAISRLPADTAVASEDNRSAEVEEGDADDEEEAEEQQAMEEADDARRPVSRSFSFTSPLSQLTDTYVSSVLASAPRCRQMMSYQGRVSCRTVIKAAVFWGRDHILSGSECGHVIAWNRWTGEPVCAVKADNSVVNRIEPHPRLPLFACSGIDSTIKIVEPTPLALNSGEDDDDEMSTDFSSLSVKCKDEATRLCAENAVYMRDTLASGSSPLERLVQLNIARAVRSIRSRFPESVGADIHASRGET